MGAIAELPDGLIDALGTQRQLGAAPPRRDGRTILVLASAFTSLPRPSTVAGIRGRAPWRLEVFVAALHWQIGRVLGEPRGREPSVKKFVQAVGNPTQVRAFKPSERGTMWLELAAITLAMAIGFSVLALRVEL
jgi:hypothetical protein